MHSSIWNLAGGTGARAVPGLVLLSRRKHGKGCHVFRGGVKNPGSTALRTVDCHGEVTCPQACNGRRFDEQVHIGVTRRAPGMLAAWLVDVPGNIAMRGCGHQGVRRQRDSCSECSLLPLGPSCLGTARD